MKITIRKKYDEEKAEEHKAETNFIEQDFSPEDMGNKIKMYHIVRYIEDNIFDIDSLIFNNNYFRFYHGDNTIVNFEDLLKYTKDTKNSPELNITLEDISKYMSLNNYTEVIITNEDICFDDIAYFLLSEILEELKISKIK